MRPEDCKNVRDWLNSILQLWQSGKITVKGVRFLMHACACTKTYGTKL